MRRRDLLLMPTLSLLPSVATTSAPVYRVTLSGPEPLTQLAKLWHYGPVVRILVRPAAAWWPSPSALPDRWQAWLDLRGGAAVHIQARGQSTMEQGHPVARDLLRMLAAHPRQ